MGLKKRWKRAAGAALAVMLTCTCVNVPVSVQAAETAQQGSSIPDAETAEKPSTSGTVYHVDSVSGNDETGDGTAEQPYQTLEKVNQITLQPGEGISLKCGSEFQNQRLAPKGKGTAEKPIVIDSYGEGNMPVIHAGGFLQTGGTNSDGTPEYSRHKEAVLIENMEYTYVTGLEVTNDDAFNTTSVANDPDNLKSGSDDVIPRRLGIHVTIDERAANTYKGEADRSYKGIVIDGCYVHDVDGNENRGVNKVDGGIGVEAIFSSAAGVYPYFDGVTIQNNRIDQCDRTGIKAIRLSDLDNFKHNTPGEEGYDPNNDADDNVANDGIRHDNIRVHDQAQRGLRIVGNYLSDIGGDGILVCESKGAVVEHNVVNGQAMRANGANAGIWAWNSFDTLFRYNESFDGPAYNQDGCSYDSDYWCAGTIFEYNYSHDTPMGFMLLMGSNNTDIVRYNVSQNDGLAWRHGAGNTYTESYIYNNVFYYDGAEWVFNNSPGGAALGSAENWSMYNNIYYNYNETTPSKWGVAETTESSWGNNLKLGGNLVYEASGIHSEGEIPGAIREDPKFTNPGGGETATIASDDMSAASDWESLKSYALQAGSAAIGHGVYVNVVPNSSEENKECWDHTSDRNAKKDFFGNALYDGVPDIGIMEMTGVQGTFSLESNASYKIYNPELGTYLTEDAEALKMGSGTSFLLEDAEGGYKIKVWNTDDNQYDYLGISRQDLILSSQNAAVWKPEDQKNGLYQLKSGDKFLTCASNGTLSMGEKGFDWQMKLQEHSKSYNAGGEKILGFSADQAYDSAKKLSGYVKEGKKLENNSAQGVYQTGRTAETLEYKIYALNTPHNLKLYVSEMEVQSRRTFDVLVNGKLVKERYTLSGAENVIEIGDVYPSDGVISVTLQNAYSETAGQMTNPILNGITADTAAFSEVNMRIDAGNPDTANMANHDGLFADTEFAATGSGWYAAEGTTTEVINSDLKGGKPDPDAGMGTALKSGRAGSNFGYKFKVAPGLYRIKLYFNNTSADPFTLNPFHVTVNGTAVKENFTLTDPDKAYDIVTTAEPKDGVIDIEFAAAAPGGKAIVNAVIVEPYAEIQGKNLALNKEVKASNQENEKMNPGCAVDGSQSTRYSSGQGNGHWISVDLGKKYMVDTVAVDWTPGSYAKKFRVEVSSDEKNWTSVNTVSDSYPGLNRVTFDPAEAQFVRIVSEENANQWGMSMTELEVYGEEITGTAAATAVTKALEEANRYEVTVDLKNIYNRYRNVSIEYTYDPSQMTLNKDSAAENEEALLKTVAATEQDNADGSKTVRFSYGIKKQDAFKTAAELMRAPFNTDPNAARKPVSIKVSFSNAEGHITELKPVIAYVPNTFSFGDLQSLISDAEQKLEAAVEGNKPGQYPTDARNAFKAAVNESKGVAEGQEQAIYEAAYLKLEEAMKVFDNAVNRAKYNTYYRDFRIGETADFAYTNASGSLEADGQHLQLAANGIAADSGTVSISEGVFRIRFATDSIEDQTLFKIGNGIQFGYDKGGGNWFFDSAPEVGWGDFTSDPAHALTPNEEHELLMKFKIKENGKYQLTLSLDGTDLGTADDIPYSTQPGKYELQTRREAHNNIIVKEVYYGDEVPAHTIQVTAGDHGTVSQTGAVSVDEETNKTLVFRPDAGYVVDKVFVDGNEAEVKDNRYTFEYVAEDHTLNVTFKKIGKPVIPAISVKLNKKNVTLEPGQEETLTVTIQPMNTTDKVVAWRSSDPAVATVTNGKVKAVKEGTAVITATAGNKSDSCTVTVKKQAVEVTSVELNKTELTLKAGAEETLTATVKPDDAADKTVTWSSSDSTIAAVDNGKVKAVKAGTAVITAAAGTKSAVCTVTVTEEAVEVTSVELNKTELTLKAGAEETLTATVKPDDAADKTVTWSSSDSTIAAVDNGKVKAVKAGTAVITAAAGTKSAVCTVTVTEEEKPLSIAYSAHIQNVGWADYVRNGESAGTEGMGRRLEALRIKLENSTVSGDIQYRTQVEDIGWQGFVSNDQVSGTEGMGKRLEALQIKLTGEMAEKYDVYYRTHIQNYGWLDWAANGASAGSEGMGLRMEAMEIQLAEKGQAAPGKTDKPFITPEAVKANPTLDYASHVQNIGWQDPVKAGEISGSEGMGLRLEALKINLDTDGLGGSIQYATQVQNIGWMDPVQNHEISGTSGKSLRLEAINIRLTGEMAEKYDIYYRTHIQDYGWLDWALNGESSGSEGKSLRMEAMEIRLVEKGQPAPGSTDKPFIK